eukprot:jgi/Tetstr1/426574/TSEL_016852.t1
MSRIRYQGGWATNSDDVVLDYIDPNVLSSPGAWFFFGLIAPLRRFQVQQDSAAVAFPRHVHLSKSLRGKQPSTRNKPTYRHHASLSSSTGSGHHGANGPGGCHARIV